MTCIVGLVGEKGVLIAGDAQGSTEWTKREDVSPKVFQLSDVLAVGYCGSGRFGQILQHHLMDSLDDPPLGMDEHRWIVRDFIPYIRQLMEDHGHLHIYHNVEEFGPSAFMLAVRGRLFTVWSDFGVDEHIYPFDSIGSGGETATGSMHGELTAGKSKREARLPIPDKDLVGIATRAITAATEMTPFVGGKISSVKTVRYTADEKALAKRVTADR
jgi:hypothetical protein